MIILGLMLPSSQTQSSSPISSKLCRWPKIKAPLIPMTLKMHSANNKGIRILGAVILRICHFGPQDQHCLTHSNDTEDALCKQQRNQNPRSSYSQNLRQGHQRKESGDMTNHVSDRQFWHTLPQPRGLHRVVHDIYPPCSWLWVRWERPV